MSCSNLFFFFSVLFALSNEPLGAADTAAEGESTLTFLIRIGGGRWVLDSERAVVALAVFNLSVGVDIVARLAHNEVTSACEKGVRATVHALPVNLLFAVFGAICDAYSKLLGAAVVTDEIFLFGLVLCCIVSFLLAVN